MAKRKAPPLAIGIVPHLARDEARALALDVVGAAQRSGVSVRIPESDARLVGLQQWAVPDETFAEGLSYAFSLGGDGTMLRTVALVSHRHVPVVGFNVGHLGYLASEQPADLAAVMRRVLSGDHGIEERLMLSIRITHNDVVVNQFTALNDAVLEKSNAGNTVRLAVSFNGVPFAVYSADGVIVATPTGSTAYAFSVRGPIVSPLMRSLVVVPISPHMLFDRSLVLDASETVRMEVLDGRTATLFVDGRDEGQLPEGSVVTCTADSNPARLVTFGPRDFHGILKAKFGLPGTATTGRDRWLSDVAPRPPRPDVVVPPARTKRGRHAP